MLYHKLIWVAVQILIASFLSRIHYEHIVLSLKKKGKKSSEFPVYHDRIQQKLIHL